jgi:hypothetical protein
LERPRVEWGCNGMLNRKKMKKNEEYEDKREKIIMSRSKRKIRRRDENKRDGEG